jgi:hypothetical protein
MCYAWYIPSIASCSNRLESLISGEPVDQPNLQESDSQLSSDKMNYSRNDSEQSSIFAWFANE